MSTLRNRRSFEVFNCSTIAETSLHQRFMEKNERIRMTVELLQIAFVDSCGMYFQILSEIATKLC